MNPLAHSELSSVTRIASPSAAKRESRVRKLNIGGQRWDALFGRTTAQDKEGEAESGKNGFMLHPNHKDTNDKQDGYLPSIPRNFSHIRRNTWGAGGDRSKESDAKHTPEYVYDFATLMEKNSSINGAKADKREPRNKSDIIDDWNLTLSLSKSRDY